MTSRNERKPLLAGGRTNNMRGRLARKCTQALDFASHNRGRLLFVGVQYTQSVVSMAAVFIAAHGMTPAQFGLFSLGMVFANSAYVVASMAEDKVLVRDLVRAQSHSGALASSAVNRMVSGLLVIAALAAGLPLLGYKGDDYATLMLFATSGYLLSLSPRAWFDVSRRMVQHSLTLLADRLLFVVLLVTLQWQGELTPLTGAYSYLGCRILSTGSQWVISSLRLDFKNAWQGLWSESMRQLQGLWSIWAASVINLALTSGNQYVLEAMSTRESLATYSLAFQFTAVVRIFQQQFLRMVAPGIAANTTHPSNPNVRKGLTKRCIQALMISLPFATGLCLLFPFLVGLAFDPTYMKAYPALIILSIWTLILGPGVVINQYLIGLNMGGAYLKINTFSGLGSLTAAFLLVPVWGGTGASVALIITHSSAILVQYLLVIKALKHAQHNHP